MKEKENLSSPLSPNPGCQAQFVNQVSKSELLRSYLVEALPRGMENRMGWNGLQGPPVPFLGVWLQRMSLNSHEAVSLALTPDLF